MSHLTTNELLTLIGTLPPDLERSEYVYELVTQRGMSQMEVSRQSTLNEGMVKSDVRRWVRETGAAWPSECAPVSADQGACVASGEDATARTVSHESEPRASVTADDVRLAVKAYLGSVYRPTPFTQRSWIMRKVVGCADWHGKPDNPIMAAIINEQADAYVLGGDLTDQAGASSHGAQTKAEARRMQQDQQAENATVRGNIEALLENTQSMIYVFPGNHDQWSIRRDSSSVPDWLLMAIPDFWERYREPLDLILEGLGDRVMRVNFPVTHYFPNGEHFETDHNNDFMFVLGDVMFSHLNKTGGMTETGVSKLWRTWFVYWARRLKLSHVNMIVHFHVHSRNMLTVGDMLLVEPGMGGAPDTEPYKDGYQAKWRPGVQGYVVFEQYQVEGQWRTDFDSVQLRAPRMGLSAEARRAAA